jgi:hypothetical protein
MKLRCAMIFSALLLTVSPSLACEINGLTEAIDRLKRGDEPTASSVALTCSKLIQNKEVGLADLVLTLHFNFDKDPRLKEAITNCTRDMIRRAC